VYLAGMLSRQAQELAHATLLEVGNGDHGNDTATVAAVLKKKKHYPSVKKNVLEF
jgi:hypothetical protein